MKVKIVRVDSRVPNGRVAFRGRDITVFAQSHKPLAVLSSSSRVAYYWEFYFSEGCFALCVQDLLYRSAIPSFRDGTSVRVPRDYVPFPW